jgi:hypothetical protein
MYRWDNCVLVVGEQRSIDPEKYDQTKGGDSTMYS